MDKKQSIFFETGWCSVNSSLMFESVPTGVSVKTLKRITVDEQNYLKLKRLGNAGDSFKMSFQEFEEIKH